MESTGSADETLPVNILLVDDSDDNRLLIDVYLKKTPHVLTMAENGAEGFEKFKATLAKQTQSLIDSGKATAVAYRVEVQNGGWAEPCRQPLRCHRSRRVC